MIAKIVESAEIQGDYNSPDRAQYLSGLSGFFCPEFCPEDLTLPDMTKFPDKPVKFCVLSCELYEDI